MCTTEASQSNQSVASHYWIFNRVTLPQSANERQAHTISLIQHQSTLTKIKEALPVYVNDNDTSFIIRKKSNLAISVPRSDAFISLLWTGS